MKLGDLGGAVLDEIPRPLYPVQTRSDHRRQLTLRRRQLFPELGAHFRDVLQYRKHNTAHEYMRKKKREDATQNPSYRHSTQQEANVYTVLLVRSEWV